MSRFRLLIIGLVTTLTLSSCFGSSDEADTPQSDADTAAEEVSAPQNQASSILIEKPEFQLLLPSNWVERNPKSLLPDAAEQGIVAVVQRTSTSDEADPIAIVLSMTNEKSTSLQQLAEQTKQSNQSFFVSIQNETEKWLQKGNQSAYLLEFDGQDFETALEQHVWQLIARQNEHALIAVASVNNAQITEELSQEIVNILQSILIKMNK